MKDATYEVVEKARRDLNIGIAASRKVPLYAVVLTGRDDGPEYALVGPDGTLLPEAAKCVLTEVLHSITQRDDALRALCVRGGKRRIVYKMYKGKRRKSSEADS